MSNGIGTGGVFSTAFEAQGSAEESKWRLSQFRRLKGTTLLVATLARERQYDSGAYSASSSSGGFSVSYDPAYPARNYLFLESRSGKSRWLVPDNSFRFLSEHELVEDPTADYEKSKTIAVVYEVAPPAGNETKETGGKTSARRRIMFYDLAGEKMKVLADNVREVTGVHQILHGEAMVLFKADDKSYVLTINPKTGEQIAKNVLAPMM